MSTEFIEALEQIQKDKGISKEILIDAIEAALISSYKRNFGSAQNVRVEINRETGEVHVYSQKRVVEEVEDDLLEISLEEAKEIHRNYEVEDIIEREVTPRNFGRIAAQTAKQVVVQRIREAERGVVYEEFINRESDIITGTIARVAKGIVYVNLGKTEATLSPTEQIPNEQYTHGERIKTYIVEVKKTTKGPQVMVSRTHPGLIKRLFELEVPEIHEGVVEIKSISREAGSRTKIAVESKDPNVDAVGACVGPKGARVQAIVDELRGEKIDIIKYSEDPSVFIASSLSPAKVVSTEVSVENKTAKVVVPDYQLSLAIGKEGQNARLAAKLTGWKIDIKSESQVKSAD
ncbi:transcription elongation protein NusA [Clostridium aceticum]|uniref:Transcription termination/antitermination protein NusA n=1 Tax=Clostridium aceticum TaxID=84022 RepID=A0A0D8I9N6_9CLOT|nr:transcription termination factor NusA [Clostridium aceticum]AKL95436.1 transcription elongation protein NusA [Clostridium aceticum]KJF25926.1 transcription elongation factor NusA [Clostridium aceticum]